jgi:hypothetical protein
MAAISPASKTQDAHHKSRQRSNHGEPDEKVAQEAKPSPELKFWSLRSFKPPRLKARPHVEYVAASR